MANLTFLPITDKIQSGSYLLYDCVCCEGGMLTVAEERLKDLTKKYDRELVTQPYGGEINLGNLRCMHVRNAPKGREGYADQIVSGTEPSTLPRDAFGRKSSTRCWPTAKSKEISKPWKQAQ